MLHRACESGWRSQLGLELLVLTLTYTTYTYLLLDICFTSPLVKDVQCRFGTSGKVNRGIWDFANGVYVVGGGS